MIKIVPPDGDYGLPATPDWREGKLPIRERQVEIGGRRLNFAEAGEGSRALVLIHGMGGRWQHWLETIPFLAQHGRVLALDLPGFGHSELPAGGISLDGYADTAAALCRAVDVEQAVVLGHSMGGPIALRFATRHEDLTEAIVLVAGATDTFNAVLGLRATAKLALQKPKKTAATLTEVLTVGIPTPRRLQRLIVARQWLRQALLWPYMHQAAGDPGRQPRPDARRHRHARRLPRRPGNRPLRPPPGTDRCAAADPLDRRPPRSHLPARGPRSLGRADSAGQNRPAGGLRAHADAGATASLQRAGRALSALNTVAQTDRGCRSWAADPGNLSPVGDPG